MFKIRALSVKGAGVPGYGAAFPPYPAAPVPPPPREKAQTPTSSVSPPFCPQLASHPDPSTFSPPDPTVLVPDGTRGAGSPQALLEAFSTGPCLPDLWVAFAPLPHGPDRATSGHWRFVKDGSQRMNGSVLEKVGEENVSWRRQWQEQRPRSWAASTWVWLAGPLGLGGRHQM